MKQTVRVRRFLSISNFTLYKGLKFVYLGSNLIKAYTCNYDVRYEP